MNLIDRNIGYSSLFYLELEALNAAKTLESPVALVLKASSREACLADMPRIIQMAKTHRVVLHELNQNNSIGQKVGEATQITGKRPIKLVCLSHGAGPSRLEIGLEAIHDPEPKETVYFYSLEDVRAEDFAGLDKDAQIFLSGCCTGDGSELSIARKIARVSGRMVFAPLEMLHRAATSFIEYPDASWKMLSYLPNGLQHIGKFMPDGSWKRSSYRTLQDALQKKQVVRGSFAVSSRLMEHYALTEDAGYRRDMAEFCQIGIPGCPEEDGIHWLLSAAQEMNDPEAQFILGGWYHPRGPWKGVEKSYENAFYWFSLAANQGHVLAQYNVGIYLLNGFGCEKSESRAARYFQLAADRGMPEALWMMGENFEYGRGGLPVSKQGAMFYYGLAAQKGYNVAEAENKVRLLKRLLEMEGLPPEEVDRMILEDLQQFSKTFKSLYH